MESLSNYQAAYKDFKQTLDVEMHRAAESFVRIGFLLNFAEETNIVEEGGYANVNEFAKAEYNIDATQVSRFVNIYKRFGVDGEPRLKDQYTNHGVAKLGIMLTLPDMVNEEISDTYSKSEITELKKFVDEENQISDIEVMCEEKDKLQQLLPEGFKQIVMQFVKDYPEEYVKIYDAITLDDLKDIVAPNGESMHKVRIPGKGAYMLFAKADGNIVAASLRTPEKEVYEWEQFFEAIKDYFVMGTDAKDSWSNIFKEPFPEETEHVNDEKADKHNVQQSKPRKESKVKTPIPRPKKEEKTATEPQKEVEEQLPGQKNIMDYPEYLPEEMKEDKPEVLKGEVVDSEENIETTEIPQNDNVQQDSEGMKVEYIAPVQNNDKESTIRGYKAGIKAALAIAQDKCEQGDWSSVIAKATDIVWRAKKIQELEAKN